MTTPTPPDLSKCGICGADAQFTDAGPGANPVSYCSRCLPANLQTRAAAGQMPLAPSTTTVPALKAQASELGLEGTSSMNKDELLAAVSKEHAAGFDTSEPKSAAAEVIEHDQNVPEDAKLLSGDGEEAVAADVEPPKKAARKK